MRALKGKMAINVRVLSFWRRKKDVIYVTQVMPHHTICFVVFSLVFMIDNAVSVSIPSTFSPERYLNMQVSRPWQWQCYLIKSPSALGLVTAGRTNYIFMKVQVHIAEPCRLQKNAEFELSKRVLAPSWELCSIAFSVLLIFFTLIRR